MKGETDRKINGQRGLWLVLGVMLLAAVVILPMSWIAIQAELRQSRNMKAMKKTLTTLNKMSLTACDLSVLQSHATRLNEDVARIPDAFPALAKPGSEFLKYSQALSQDSDNFRAHVLQMGCADLSRQLQALKESCKQCHDQFRPNREDELTQSRSRTGDRDQP